MPTANEIQIQTFDTLRVSFNNEKKLPSFYNQEKTELDLNLFVTGKKTFNFLSCFEQFLYPPFHP